jgi:hypothetical protein
MTINFSLFPSEEKKKRGTQKTLFGVISFNLIQCIKSKINNTPFPNKCKTLFHSQIFLWLFFPRGESKISFLTINEMKKEHITLPPFTSRGVCADLDFHKCRNSLENKVQAPEQKKQPK